MDPLFQNGVQFPDPPVQVTIPQILSRLLLPKEVQLSPSVYQVSHTYPEMLRGNEREGLLSSALLTFCMPTVVRAGLAKLGQALYIGGRDSLTGAITCCLPVSTVAESWSQEIELGVETGTLT